MLICLQTVLSVKLCHILSFLLVHISIFTLDTGVYVVSAHPDSRHLHYVQIICSITIHLIISYCSWPAPLKSQCLFYSTYHNKTYTCNAHHPHLPLSNGTTTPQNIPAHSQSLLARSCYSVRTSQPCSSVFNSDLYSKLQLFLMINM